MDSLCASSAFTTCAVLALTRAAVGAPVRRPARHTDAPAAPSSTGCGPTASSSDAIAPCEAPASPQPMASSTQSFAFSTTSAGRRSNAIPSACAARGTVTMPAVAPPLASHVGPARRRRPADVWIDDLVDEPLRVLGGEEPDTHPPLRDLELLLPHALLEVGRPLEEPELLVGCLLRRGAEHLVGDPGGVAEVRVHPVRGLDQPLDDLDRRLLVVPGQLLPHQDVAAELEPVVRRPRPELRVRMDSCARVRKGSHPTIAWTSFLASAAT